VALDEIRELGPEDAVARRAPGKAGWTPKLATNLAGGIVLFATLFFTMICVMIWKNKSVESLLRIFGILLIIIASVFLVIVGYSDQQIAPVMGLMETIAGDLLSRRPESGTASPTTTRARVEDDSAGAPRTQGLTPIGRPR
jgi:hypothetical protein